MKICWFALLLLCIAGCSSQLGGHNYECPDDNSAIRWNEGLIDLHSNGRFREVIEAFERSTGCVRPHSWQTLFSSSLALVLDGADDVDKRRIRSLIGRFEKTSSFAADPGPLLIALGEDSRAARWYEKLGRRPQGADSYENAEAGRRFARSVLVEMRNARWSSLESEDRLRVVARLANPRPGSPEPE